MAGALRTPIMAAMSGRETSLLVTRGLRLARIALHLLHGLLTATLFFPFFPRARCRQEIRTWSCVWAKKPEHKKKPSNSNQKHLCVKAARPC